MFSNVEVQVLIKEGMDCRRVCNDSKNGEEDDKEAINDEKIRGYQRVCGFNDLGRG